MPKRRCGKQVHVKIASHFPSSIQVLYRKAVCIGRQTCTVSVWILGLGCFDGHGAVDTLCGREDVTHAHVPTGHQHQDSPRSNAELLQCCSGARLSPHSVPRGISSTDQQEVQWIFFRKKAGVLTSIILTDSSCFFKVFFFVFLRYPITTQFFIFFPK